MTNVTVPVTVPAEDLWSGIWGACPEYWSWWREFDFLDCDWDVPGQVKVTAWDPNEGSGEGEGEIVKIITLDDIVQAYAWYIGAGYKYSYEDMDSVYSDVVLQKAFYGEVIYG